MNINNNPFHSSHQYIHDEEDMEGIELAPSDTS